MLKLTLKSKLLSVIEKQTGIYRRCFDVTFSEHFVNIRKQRVNNGEMRIRVSDSESDFSSDEIECFHSDIAEDESEDDGNLYYGVSGPEPYIYLSHLQVPENGLFRVQVSGLTVRQFTLTDSTRQIGL